MESVQAAAIIAASGAGLRMGASLKKQYLLLDGVPVLARAVNIFTEHPDIRQIVVVISPGDTAFTRKILKPFCPLERLLIVEGGSRRQDSVFNGLQAVPAEVEFVCIHDGARPLADRKLIDAVMEAACRWGAAVPVLPVTDTLKEIDARGFIVKTIPRHGLRRAQTPQIFRRDLISEAYRKARMLGIEATDDA
jgi:2-C-methyl-D-erythritol 4-phosphate cytidylyltransferase